MSFFSSFSSSFSSLLFSRALPALGLCALLPAAAHAQAQDLYVSNQNSNTINRFASTGAGMFSMNGTLVSPALNNPTGLAFDGAGDLFAADNGSNTITEFLASGGTATLSGGGLNGPRGLAFDTRGDLFAADNNGSTVTEFAAGGTPGMLGMGQAVTTSAGAPLFTNSPTFLAFDGAGNLFTADFNGGTVSEFAATAAPGTFGAGRVVESGLSSPTGLAVDKGGDLFVADNGSNTISEFLASGGTATLSGGGLNGPRALAFDGLGNLFVADSNGGTVSEFASAGAPGAFSAGRVIESGLPGPAFLAFGPSVSAPVPESSGAVSLGLMLALGMGGLVVAGKRRKAAARL